MFKKPNPNKTMTQKVTPSPPPQTFKVYCSISDEEAKEKLHYPCRVLGVHDPVPFSFDRAEGLLVIRGTGEEKAGNSQQLKDSQGSKLHPSCCTDSLIQKRGGVYAQEVFYQLLQVNQPLCSAGAE